ncbi:MAG: RNA polymerase sigma factor [Planctomycetota bacterium]|jgi:RNA polymerase sigma-70 factor (ECF subfamily)
MDKSKLSFDEVYGEFHEKIGRYVERMVGKDGAEDVTQEVFMKVNKGLEGFRGESSLSTWIYRIATNAARDKLKSRSFREDSSKVRLSGPDEETQQEDGSICTEEKSLSAEREAIRNEMNECIREFVDKLDENYRTVIILSELKELKNQDIADILGISLDAVKIRLHRARLKLKEVFEAGCEFYRNEDNELACDRKSEDSEKNEA